MKHTIPNAILDVLRENGGPMTAADIYNAIQEKGLYEFKAQDPLHVVTSQIRRHCREFNFQSSRAMKYFTMTPDGRYELLDKPMRLPPNLYKVPTVGRSRQATLVSVPSNEDDVPSECDDVSGPSHSEIQYKLLELGAEMGLSVWAPVGDRGKRFDGKVIGSVSRLLNRLPVQFDVATTKTIENIDVIWLEQHEIRAAFEIEHTSSIYSGLLRMSDLLTMQPNINIKLFLVAPDERFLKFTKEVARPTFSRRLKPVHSVCRFLPYARLIKKLNEAKGLVRYLKPEFIDQVAEEYVPPDDGIS